MKARWLFGVVMAAFLAPLAASYARQARTIEIAVAQNGFEPARVKVAKGEPLKLVVTRKTDQTCAKEIVIPDENIRAELPLGKPVTLSFTPKRTGEITYACGMNMFTGVIEVASIEGSGHKGAPSMELRQECDSLHGIHGAREAVPVIASPVASTKPTARIATRRDERRPTSGRQPVHVLASPATPTKRGGLRSTKLDGPRGVQPVPVMAGPVSPTKLAGARGTHRRPTC